MVVRLDSWVFDLPTAHNNNKDHYDFDANGIADEKIHTKNAFCTSFGSFEFPILFFSSKVELQHFRPVINICSFQAILLRRVRWSQISLAPPVSTQNESMTVSPNTEVGPYPEETCLCKHLPGRPQKG